MGFWTVQEASAAVPTLQRERGVVAVENGPWEMSLRLSKCSAPQKHAVMGLRLRLLLLRVSCSH